MAYLNDNGEWEDGDAPIGDGNAPTEYVTETYDTRGNLVETSSAPAPEYAVPSGPGAASDARHKYVGRDSRGDVWQLVDDGGNVIEWAVSPGAQSGAIIPGTANNLGPASSMTVAQPTTPTAPAGDKIPDDPAHRYVGTDATGDIYRMTDTGGRVIQWHVKVNDDSRNMLPGTAQIIAQPDPTAPTSPSVPGGGATTTAPTVPSIPTPGTGDHIPDDPAHTYVGTDAAGDVYQLTDAGGNIIRWHVRVNDDSRNIIPGSAQIVGKASGGAGTVNNPPTVPEFKGGVPGGVLINPADDMSSIRPKQSLSSHKYVGRDARGDVWQIFDGTNVIEWAVKVGDESGNIIPGSARNLGPPSTGTIAQNDGTAKVPPPAPTGPAGSGGSGVPTVTDNTKNLILVGLGVLGAVISAVK